MADLVRRHGGKPLSAPAMQEVPLPESPAVRDAIDGVIGSRFLMVVFLTGVGARALIDAADSLGRKQELLEGLRRGRVVCRGPKPLAVCRRNDIPVYLVAPEPNTSEDLLRVLRADPIALSGARVLLQHYGVANAVVKDGLEGMGAAVVDVSLYAWALPTDTAPVRRAIEAITGGHADAVLFTSQQQARNLFALAEKFGAGATLKAALHGLVVGSVGPIVTRTLADFGISPQVVPEHPKMGSLVVALGEYWGGTK